MILQCGNQGLALHGHWDDHTEWEKEQAVSANEEKFIEIVRFRAKNDETLKKCLQNAPQNAWYTSKTIQNQLIEVIEVKEAKFYSIIADEVCDVSNKEQLYLCLCYMYVRDSRVK